MFEKNNFDWIDEVVVQRSMAQQLINHYREINPTWTPELDAAMRILLSAINGRLGSRESNERHLNRIETQIAQNTLCNSDMFEIAVDILEDSYFFQNCDSNTMYFTQDHCRIVRAAHQDWEQRIVRALTNT